MVVKKGNPKSDELEQLADYIDHRDWKKVARKLKIHDPKITVIHKENKDFYEKIYHGGHILSGVLTLVDLRSIPLSVIIYLLTILK